MKKITNLQELKDVLVENKMVDFFILFKGNLRSGKQITYLSNNKYEVYNNNDSTTQILNSFEEFSNLDITNIGYAIEKESFYLE